MIKLTENEFIKKANKVHNDYYNYNNTVYLNSKIKIKINCPVHGKFEQRPNDHLNGSGCKMCGIEKSANTRRTKELELIDEFNKIHNFKYKYENLNYKNNNSLIIIYCEIHSYFKQSIKNHKKGFGCSECSNKKQYSTSEIIFKFKNIHNNRYDYSLVNYEKAHDKVKIICAEHGVFEQTPHEHLKGQNCIKCSKVGISIIEKEVVNFIKELNVNVIENTKKIIKPLELDIYVPILKKAIEFNGEYWYYNQSNKKCKPKGYHAMKSKMCKEKGIRLLHIREDLWKRDKEHMKQVIIKFLNK
jgi:hypothetical protein